MMAKKSEFAQKLLDDLRMRKERMAAGAGENYGQSYNSIAARDAHGQSMKGRRGERGMVAHKTGTSKMDGMHRRSSSRSGSIGVGNSSKQLVPFSQGHGGNQMGDLSVALDFAFKNGQKLMMDPSMSRLMNAFLQQITQGSVIDFRNFERKGNIKRASSSSFQISTFHINEVSKGAQKLNKILADCSEGLNRDRYSIEIGNELFKSAKNLEESLRMLVGLQEAASNMTTPQRKSRIRLLEGNEEDEDDKPTLPENQKQINRPRFSFDTQSSSNNAQVNREASNSLMQRSAALVYLTKDQISNVDQSSSSALSMVSHKRSFSHGGEFSSNTAASEKRKEMSLNAPKSEKKGLPNVIAKLMGLEESLQHVESKNKMRKEPETKQKNDKAIQLNKGSTDSHLKNNGVELNGAQIVKTRLLQADRIPIYMSASFDINEKKWQHNGSFSIQNAVQGRKQLQKDNENAVEKSSALTERAKKSSTSENIVTRLSQQQVIRDGSQEKERKQNFANERKLKASMRQVPSIPGTCTHILSQGKRSNQEETYIFPAKEMHNERNFETIMRNSKRKLVQNQQRPQNGFGSSKRILFGQPENINERYKPDRKENKLGIIRLHVKDQKGSEAGLNRETQQYQTRESVSTSSEAHSLITRDRNNPDVNTSCIFTKNMGMDNNSDHSLFSKDQGVETKSKKTNAQPLKEDKYVQVTNSNTVPKSKEHKSNSVKMIDQVLSRNKDLPQCFNKSQEQQSVASKATKFLQDDRGNSKCFSEEDSRSGTQQSPSNMKPPINQEEKPSMVQRPDLTDITCIQTQSVASEASGHEHAPLCRVKDPGKPKACNIEPKEAGIDRMSSDVTHLSQAITHETRKLDPLTEVESQLKHILVSNRRCLNTAEALFKLNIPVNILQTGDQECEDHKNKHMLDAGYEIMKRKGRIQDLNFHPFSKRSISFPKVGSLNFLVKQLYKDFQSLKSYGGIWGDDTGAYLLKMVERDMHHGDPDLNCMWDYGWNHSSFAITEQDDTIQQLERYILDDLVDKILQDI